METLKFDDLTQGGFAGLIERRFVMDQRVFGSSKKPGVFDGIGNFVYLADANFLPKGETGMHSHKEIDVISVMVDGRVSHAGSLEHGQSLQSGAAQVQRAGAQGFKHNEINPDDTENNMIQLWVMPDEAGEAAGYKMYEPKQGEVTHIYGGPKGQDDTFYGGTSISVANPDAGQTIEQEGKVMAYLTRGKGTINGEAVNGRTLVRSDSGVKFIPEEDSQLILIYLTQ
ncbi:MAG: pirin family protein [Oceanospirillaceae bacterium]|nr:pirin family protein [Oceanospirillaceae bacterium]